MCQIYLDLFNINDLEHTHKYSGFNKGKYLITISYSDKLHWGDEISTGHDCDEPSSIKRDH